MNPAILSPVPPIRFPTGESPFSRPLPSGSPMKDSKPVGFVSEMFGRGTEGTRGKKRDKGRVKESGESVRRGGKACLFVLYFPNLLH